MSCWILHWMYQIFYKIYFQLINKRINNYLNPDSTGNPKYIWCLFLTVTNDMLDVNLEPNKDKIMFHNEVNFRKLNNI